MSENEQETERVTVSIYCSNCNSYVDTVEVTVKKGETPSATVSRCSNCPK